MASSEINKRIEQLQDGIADPQFHADAFSLIVKEQKKSKDLLETVLLEQFDEISIRADQSLLQESCAMRNVLRTRSLANLLVNDKGEVQTRLLPAAITILENNLYSLGPGRQHDAMRQEQILQALKMMQASKELSRLLQSISRPYAHRFADQMIRDTLVLPPNIAITDTHARRAVLAAWLCTLRQNVGSCFATAPAIVIHDEQPINFLRDLNDLLATGRLKRTYGGIEYSVPFSTSWGSGDLKKPVFLPSGYLMEEIPLWESPGLLAACESVGLIKGTESLEERTGQLKEQILKVLRTIPSNAVGVYITAERLIHSLLQQWMGITPEDIQSYLKRPQNLFKSGMMQMVEPASVKGHKHDLVAAYINMEQQAFAAFKAMTDNALLKAWEFTLASLSESKSQFTRWNLYASLGLGAQDDNGIGAKLYDLLKNKIDDCNRKIADIQYEYEQLFAQLKQLEVTIKHSSTEQEAKWINVEYQAKRNEFYTLEAMRDDWNYKAQRLANSFDNLVEVYDRLFPLYFQEVYDADMQDVQTGPYDDSPAGFRLFYKHGRSNTAQWTPIHSPTEFIEALSAFFITSESEVRGDPAFKGLEDDLGDIVTHLVLHIKTREFLESALYRMAAAHRTTLPKNPLDNLDQVEKKPWVYTSGGTMKTLVNQYFKREQDPMEVSRWVENPTELLMFLIDTIKQSPAKIQEEFLANPNKNMLMHSPTHAFNYKPGKPPFKEAWLSDAFTYTWVRDQWIEPAKNFIEKLWLDQESVQYLLEQLVLEVPENFRHYLRKVFQYAEGDMRPNELRNWILHSVSQERALMDEDVPVLHADMIDGFLYSFLPICHRTQMREKVTKILQKISAMDQSRLNQLLEIMEHFDRDWGSFQMVGARQLQKICLGLLCLELGQPTTKENLHNVIAQAAQELGFALPAPIFFADTNWVKDYFAFVVNPGTNQLDFWRMDVLGGIGSPISSWRRWLNGSRKDIPWGIYSRPWEYTI